MEFYIGDKKYSYTEEQLELQLLNHGDEADVYSIKNQAVKMYKPYCRKIRLDEDTVEVMKRINTKRLLLPRETVYDSTGKFIGHTSKLIKEGSKSTIRRLKMHKMLEEMKLQTEDVKLLTKHNITIYDLRITDVLFGDGIYYCDSGSFKIEDDMSRRDIEIENMRAINELLIDDIFGVCCSLTKKEKQKLYDMTAPGEYLSELILPEDINENESTLHFVKRITK